MARRWFPFTLMLTAITGWSGLALPGLARTAEVKLRASDLAEFDTFGTSVALRGDVTLIGAPEINFNLNGKAYVFSLQRFELGRGADPHRPRRNGRGEIRRLGRARIRRRRPHRRVP